MTLEVPISQGVRSALHSCATNGWLEKVHPGLVLDKFPLTYNPENGVDWSKDVQRPTVEQVARLSQSPPPDFPLADLSKRWKIVTAGATTFPAVTIGPLTLHLARASALENAGICLHPLYGFTYLPGSGLKGMARAYAETIWLPTQTDQKQAWRRIEDVFGWAPGSDIGKNWKPEGIAERAKDDKARVGGIVFHDAWPETWPQLVVDIVNNHHPDYYQAAPDDNARPPGDWENPVPVYFLAVKPGTTFTFAISKRRANLADDLLSLARQWLLGALCHLGAGAKTVAGYGAFKPVSEAAPALPSQRRAAFETTLELITPGFLAGASQQKEDCDLRPATLRGLLRWWWRTMHAGFMDVKTLRALEAAIWGDTRGGGAVRIVVEKVSGEESQTYSKRSKANFNEQQKRSEHGIPNEDPRKTTQGLWYMSYGMDESGRPAPRFVLEPPASWLMRLVARPTRFFADREDAANPKRAGKGQPVTALQVLEQSKAALWLLSHFGAVGSKARKGFASLAANGLDGWKQEACHETAAQLRQAMQLPSDFDAGRARSPSLQQMLDPVEVVFSWPDVWNVLDQVGFAYQAFAKRYKHRLEKKALGLPRRIGNPVQGKFSPTPPVAASSRHSSPIHIHVERQDSGWVVRTIAFPAAHLPDLNTSRTFLTEFLNEFGDELRRRAALPPPSSGPRQGAPPPRQQTPPPSRGPSLPKPGERVQGVLLEEKTRKGGWRARHVATGITGPIQNSDDVPDEKKPGETVPLIVQSANEREIAFRYPTAADEQRAQKPQGKPKGGPGGKPPPRGGRR